MKVSVRLFSILTNGRFQEADIEIDDTSTLFDLLQGLDISMDDIAVVMVNGKAGTFTQSLMPEDRIALIPPVGGG